MVDKVLGRMEVLRGFVQVPTKSRNELIGDMPTPCKTLVNGETARIDNYGRLWCPCLKDKFRIGSRIQLIKTKESCQAELVKSAEPHGVRKLDNSYHP